MKEKVCDEFKGSEFEGLITREGIEESAKKLAEAIEKDVIKLLEAQKRKMDDTIRKKV